MRCLCLVATTTRWREEHEQGQRPGKLGPREAREIERFAERGIAPQHGEHVQQRMAILADLQRRDIRDIQTVTSIIQNFYATR